MTEQREINCALSTGAINCALSAGADVYAEMEHAGFNDKVKMLVIRNLALIHKSVMSLSRDSTKEEIDIEGKRLIDELLKP